jgi:hypothetical protein
MGKIWESRSFVSCLLSPAPLEYPSQRDAQSKTAVRCTSLVNWQTPLKRATDASGGNPRTHRYTARMRHILKIYEAVIPWHDDRSLCESILQPSRTGVPRFSMTSINSSGNRQRESYA